MLAGFDEAAVFPEREERREGKESGPNRNHGNGKESRRSRNRAKTCEGGRKHSNEDW